jgi:CheY-like chemotaxis protein
MKMEGVKSNLHEIRLKVLLVEDNPGDAVLVRSALEDASLPLVELVHVKTLHDAVARLKQADIDLVLTDLGLPDSYGFDACARLCANDQHVPVVVLSGRSDPVIRQDGAQAVRVVDTVLQAQHQGIGRKVRTQLLAGRFGVHRLHAEEHVARACG